MDKCQHFLRYHIGYRETGNRMMSPRDIISEWKIFCKKN